jgi:hypothetical protein
MQFTNRSWPMQATVYEGAQCLHPNLQWSCMIAVLLVSLTRGKERIKYCLKCFLAEIAKSATVAQSTRTTGNHACG